MGSVSDAAGMPTLGGLRCGNPRATCCRVSAGPCGVSLDLPPGTAESIESHGFYMDVVVAEPEAAAI